MYQSVTASNNTMKNKQLFLFIAIFIMAGLTKISAQISNSTSAQMAWSDEMDDGKKMQMVNIIGSDEKNFYGLVIKAGAIGAAPSKIYLQRFSKELRIGERVELELKRGKNRLKFSHSLFINNKLYVFFTVQNNKLKERVLFVQEISKNTLLPKGKLMPLSSAKIKSGFNILTRKTPDNIGKFWGQADKNILRRMFVNKEPFFGIKTSEDNNKLVSVYKVLQPKVKTEMVGINVYDAEFNTLWSETVDLNFGEKEFVAENYEVDNNGNCFILGRLYNSKRKALSGIRVKEKVKGNVNYSYLLLKVNSEGNIAQRYALELDGKYINNMKLLLNDKEQLICAGLYSNELNGQVVGSFYNRIDLTTGDLEISKNEPFTMDLITKNLTKKQAEKTEMKFARGKDVGLFAYSIDDLYFKNDGTVALVAEQHYVTQSTSASTDGRTSTTFYYNFNDILVINFKQETGEILWSSKIDKKQRTGNDFGLNSSYALLIDNDKMYFVFNDNLKNFGPETRKYRMPFDRSKHSVTTVVEMDANGKYKQETLFSAKAKSMQARPVVSKQISAKEMVIFGSYKNHKSQFIKLKFDTNDDF